MNYLMKGAGIASMLVAAAAAAQDGPPPSATRPDSIRSIQQQPGTSTALGAVLTRSCGDCHSNTMARRWYTRVPPFSMIMARGAREGRKAVDFSEWTRYSPAQQQAFLLASCADATNGKMPMKAYVMLRGDARLSPQDVETICSAARQPLPVATSTNTPRNKP